MLFLLSAYNIFDLSQTDSSHLLFYGVSQKKMSYF